MTGQTWPITGHQRGGLSLAPSPSSPAFSPSLDRQAGPESRILSTSTTTTFEAALRFRDQVLACLFPYRLSALLLSSFISPFFSHRLLSPLSSRLGSALVASSILDLLASSVGTPQSHLEIIPSCNSLRLLQDFLSRLRYLEFQTLHV